MVPRESSGFSAPPDFSVHPSLILDPGSYLFIPRRPIFCLSSNMLLPRSISLSISGLLGYPLLGIAIPSELQSILKNTHKSDAYSYPTDLTRDIFPVRTPIFGILYTNYGLDTSSFSQVGSPRTTSSSPYILTIAAITGETYLSILVGIPVVACIPLITPGLSKGCSSTEADVWLINGTLYVRSYYPVLLD